MESDAVTCNRRVGHAKSKAEIKNLVKRRTFLHVNCRDETCEIRGRGKFFSKRLKARIPKQ